MADAGATPVAARTVSRPTSRLGSNLVTLARQQADSLALWAALLLTIVFTHRSMGPALRSNLLVQDDARQHIFWMARYRDPQLFQNDLIADYYETLAPLGHRALYWLASQVFEPLMVTKVLPLLLGLLAVVFTYLLIRRIGGGPAAGLLGATLVSWYGWQNDDLPSATPRAWLLPLMAALLWALASERRLLVLLVAVLSGLLYPPAAAIGLAVLCLNLVRFEGWRPRLASNRADWLLTGAAMVLVLLVVLPTRGVEQRYGPLVTSEQARAMPEFQEGGRDAYFKKDLFAQWIQSRRSGLGAAAMNPVFRGNVPHLLELALLATALPLALLIYYRQRRPTGLNRRAVVLLYLLVASLGLFLLAHLLLFKLYLPTRYVRMSLPLVLGVAAGLGLELSLRGLAVLLRVPARPIFVGLLAAILAVGILWYPANYYGAFREDPNPAISEWLRSQPPSVVVAGMPLDADYVPMFGQRTVVASTEYAISFHLGYYGEIRRRMRALVDGYFAASLPEVVAFAERYGVDLFLVNRDSFDEGNLDRMIGSSVGAETRPFYPMAVRAYRNANGSFALREAVGRCAVFVEREVSVVPTSCLREAG
jgi:hypothetical protein